MGTNLLMSEKEKRGWRAMRSGEVCIVMGCVARN